ncbi:MAG: hypothetical protein EOO58_03675 [Hymenobacter sp.]|nr:MAG: hypothetical protein EOO58_03675 [Hymenobacter sp.]
MLNEQTAPVAWALLLYELDDARDGIKSLLRDMTEDKEFDEIDFRIHMAHIYGHLNRAWNGRNATDQQHEADALPEEWNAFPIDLNSPSPF